jgi:hypothetical protein
MLKPSDKERETRRAVQAQMGLERRARELGDSRAAVKLQVIEDQRITCSGCGATKGRTSYGTGQLLVGRESRYCNQCVWAPAASPYPWHGLAKERPAKPERRKLNGEVASRFVAAGDAHPIGACPDVSACRWHQRRTA